MLAVQARRARRPQSMPFHRTSPALMLAFSSCSLSVPLPAAATAPLSVAGRRPLARLEATSPGANASALASLYEASAAESQSA